MPTYALVFDSTPILHPSRIFKETNVSNVYNQMKELIKKRTVLQSTNDFIFELSTARWKFSHQSVANWFGL